MLEFKQHPMDQTFQPPHRVTDMGAYGVDAVGNLVDKLREDPRRFHDTGYERLLEALRLGNDPDALKQALRDRSDIAGDLLWVIAELEEVEPFVSEARQHLSSSDKGPAGYAMEIVLRGGKHSVDLRAAFDRMEICDLAVCQHAVRTLFGAGITRLIVILEAAGYEWSCALAKRIAPSMEPFCRKDFQDLIEGLVIDQDRARQVVGLTLAGLASQQHESFLSVFSRSDESWIREFGTFLKGLREPLDVDALDEELKRLGISVPSKR